MAVTNGPDVDAQAALAADRRRVFSYAFLDINGDPQRVTDGPYSVTFSGTGDEDLDGFTFTAIDATFVSVSDVHQKEGGGDTVTCTLSGLASLDDELMTTLGNRANFMRRDARFWRQMRHPDTLQPIGAIWHHHTGVMSAPKHTGDGTSGILQLEVESYLTYFAGPSNRTYLDQSRYDPGDKSADLSIAIANGVTAAGNPMADYSDARSYGASPNLN